MKKKKRSSVKKQYNDFWKDIVENPDGTLNKEQVMKELSDFSLLIDNLTTIVCELTGHRASYPHTDPMVVISLHEECVAQAYDSGYEDAKNDYGISESIESTF